jgi:plastocyanin
MYRKILFGVIGTALLTILFAACNIVDQANVASGPQVKMGGSTFLQTTVTIKKGQTLTLVDSSSAAHIIANGTWQNGTAKASKEGGAPTINLNFVGSDTHATPAFTTAGTYNIYCTIHGGMNLTVTVQ